MTRTRIILTTVLLVCVVAVVVPNWREIWLEVAYEGKPMVGRTGSLSCGMHYLKKRLSWLPGEPILVPDQPCMPCRVQSHRRCLEAKQMVNRRGSKLVFHQEQMFFQTPTSSKDMVLDPSNWHCTCPDPSHAWNR